MHCLELICVDPTVDRMDENYNVLLSLQYGVECTFVCDWCLEFGFQSRQDTKASQLQIS